MLNRSFSVITNLRMDFVSSSTISTLCQVVAELLPPSASQDLLAACLQRQAEAGAGGCWPDLAPLLSAKIKHVKLDQQHAVSGDTSQYLAQVIQRFLFYNHYIILWVDTLFHNLILIFLFNTSIKSHRY